MNLTRREAIKSMAILMGATVVGPRLLAGQFGLQTPMDFSDADIALLDEISETIIPATNIPGAKAAKVGAFIAMMVADCYGGAAQKAFRDGLTKLPADYEARYFEKFIGGQAANRTQFLNALDTEQRKYTATIKRKLDEFSNVVSTEEVSPHYFRIMRELTILGYFSSEIGSTKAVKYLEVPGRYDGNVPYKKGDEWFI
jgi:hypothetical protein